MRKFIFFPLWKIEDIEKYLESMEQNGYRLEKIKFSYWFCFTKSTSKQMCYFLSYKSFRGSGMGHYDYALLSKHGANPVESKWCFYTMYRTKDYKENMSLLYESRLDYIKTKLLENALTSLFLIVLFSVIFLFAVVNQSGHSAILVFCPIMGICVFLTIYYFYGYFKQKIKSKYYKENTGDGYKNTL